MSKDVQLANVAPVARDFIAAGLASFDHACTHAGKANVTDAAQVVLSLAHGVEMLCKGVLLHRGESIHEKGSSKTISLRDALAKIGKVRHAAIMFVLVDRRDPIQHAAAYMDPRYVQDYLQMAREFAGDLLGSIGLSVSICPEQPPVPQVGPPIRGELVDMPEKEEQQRDASYGDGVLAWAQGKSRLRVRVMRREGGISWLSPSDSFEYMPHTDGHHLVAYRQSGGIVVYDLPARRREVVVETGAPGDVESGLIVAQGIGVPDGLGGGVWLLSTDASNVEQLSEGGDSPRLSMGRVVWQEFRDHEYLILGLSVDNGDQDVLVRGGQHPALHENLLAWTGLGPRPPVYMRDLSRGEEKILSEAGILPDVRNGLVAFLELRGNLYDLRVVKWSSGSELLHVQDVGFPIGRGPLLTDSEVVWESRAENPEHRLWHLALPSPVA